MREQQNSPASTMKKAKLISDIWSQIINENGGTYTPSQFLCEFSAESSPLAPSLLGSRKPPVRFELKNLDVETPEPHSVPSGFPQRQFQ